MNLKDHEIETAAINQYGTALQMIVAIEELSELQKEITKLLRDRAIPTGIGNISHLSEEMADVYIMLEQLELIFHNTDEIKKLET